ncbi:MAG TPA: PEP-CTERM sorting domain-containing protein [Stellaceae bacterium]|nr:PEP-CTERM sorting domain-containing protein [Stellaceae bacterium]
MQRSGRVTAGAAGLLLAMIAGAQAGPVASDRIIAEEDSPPPFLTGFVPFDITIPEATPETSISIPIGTATFPIVNGPAFVSSSVLLREPDQAISDVLTLAATRTGATATATIYSVELDFISTGEGGPVIDPPGGFIASVQETGGLQDITDLLFAPLTERTGIVPTIGFLVQSDIPEPGTLSLLGAGLFGLGLIRLRRRH